MPPNFVLLDATLPDVTILIAAMVQARDAVERRSKLCCPCSTILRACRSAA
jgi:hypothetical protein